MPEIIRHDEIHGAVIHEYDGIEEADNRLPHWWLATFYITIAFAPFYWLGYHVLKVLPLPNEAYEQANAQQGSATLSVDDLLAAAAEQRTVSAGKALFGQHCAVCHEAGGEGKIGPNLTDRFWVHGGAPLDIYNSISKGIPAKGMPPWGPSLGQLSVKKITAFVLSIRNTNVTGKAAEGKEWSGEQDAPAKPEAAAATKPDADSPSSTADRPKANATNSNSTQ